MVDQHKTPEDTAVEKAMGALLRWGVILAAVVTLAGGAVYLAKRLAEPAPAYQHFPIPDRPTELNSVLGVMGFALSGRGQGLIQLGVLLLIATPVARVAFSVYFFARQRDRLYIVVTVIVLVLLLFSLFSGGWLPGG
jgi:uncharacterized membrane protein